MAAPRVALPNGAEGVELMLGPFLVQLRSALWTSFTVAADSYVGVFCKKIAKYEGAVRAPGFTCVRKMFPLNDLLVPGSVVRAVPC